MTTDITLGNVNPQIISLIGGHQESGIANIKCPNGFNISEAIISVDLCGDFDALSEYITLNVNGTSLGKLSSGKQDWNYHRVMTDEDITNLVKGKSEFKIEAIPSAQVHQLWANAWGLKITFSYKIGSEQVITVSNWKLNETAFEPDDNAIYTFDIENTSGMELSNVKLHLVKDEGAWKGNNVSAVSPANMTFDFPKLNAGEKKLNLAVGFKSISGKVGKYSLPQIEIEYEYVAQKIDFIDSTFVVEISPD